MVEPLSAFGKACEPKALQRAHGQLEAAASKLGRPPRKASSRWLKV